jgi:hypothetical protein
MIIVDAASIETGHMATEGTMCKRTDNAKGDYLALPVLFI